MPSLSVFRVSSSLFNEPPNAPPKTILSLTVFNPPDTFSGNGDPMFCTDNTAAAFLSLVVCSAYGLSSLVSSTPCCYSLCFSVVGDIVVKLLILN